VVEPTETLDLREGEGGGKDPRKEDDREQQVHGDSGDIQTDTGRHTCIYR